MLITLEEVPVRRK